MPRGQRRLDHLATCALRVGEHDQRLGMASVRVVQDDLAQLLAEVRCRPARAW
jgi:hypothetical protein